MYIDNPIVGVGAGNGGVRMPEYVSGYDNPWTQWGRTFHGTIPQVMAELGTLGLVFYLLMIYRAFKYLRKVQKKYVGGSDFSLAIANAIMGSIVGYIVTATFLSTTYYPQLWTFYTLTLILYGFVKARASESRVSEVVIEEGNHPFPGGITAQTDS
jgi:O-antigen ligase